MNYNAQQLKQAARGRWLKILSAVGGIEHALLDGKHHPCPKCGGKDRFRLIDQEAGALYCNQCFHEGNGDGLAAIQWARGWDFPTTVRAVGEYLGLNGSAEEGTRPSGEWRIVETYDYQDEKGELLYQVCRMEPKDFLQRRPKPDGGWEWSTKGIRKVLYRLPELLQAGLNEPIWIVEGEKDSDRLAGLKCLATCNAGGAGKWRPEFAPHFKGRHVAILPDNDKPGRQHADQVAASLQGVAASVKVVELPGLPEKGDVSDWLDAGHTPDDLWELTVDTPEWEPSRVSKEVSDAPRWKLFPVVDLPEPLAGFVRAASKAIGCPPCFLALPLLAVAAAMIGTSRALELKRGWRAPAILWTAIVGESGTTKTPAMKLVLRPIKKRQGDAFKRHSETMKQFEAQMACYEKAMAAWKRGTRSNDPPPSKPEPPKVERCIISDITVEAVAPILLENPRGVLSASDELATWLGSFDRYANGKGDAAHWLSMHSGESIVVDRKTGQPRTIFVRAAAVSICGGIQPGILHRALGSEHRENGLLARLLLACPPREQKRWTEAEIDPFVEQQYAALIDGLAALEPTEDDEGEPCPVVLRLTPEAKAVWQEFYNAHAAEQANLIGDLAAAWSKLEETAARLALVICCIRVASAAPPAKPWATDNPIPQPAEVNADDMRRAVRLTEWFKHETQRVYSILGESDEERRKRELVELIERRGGTIAPRELMQASRQFRESAEVAEAALGGLVKDGIGAWEAQPPGPQGGRPARVFRLYDSGNGNTNPETSEENEVPLPLPQGNGETEKRNRQPGCVSGPSPLNDGSMTCSA